MAGSELGRADLPPRLVYVPSGNHLRLVDLAARTVTTVFRNAGADRVAGNSRDSHPGPAAIP